MSREGKILLLFTSSYPYGLGEQFIETEILFLSEAFEKIYIFPLAFDGALRSVPPNVEVVKHKLYRPYNRISLLLRYWNLIWKAFRFEKRESVHRDKYARNISKHVNYLLHRINDAKWLKQELDRLKLENVVVYSYWFNHWVTLLTLIHAMGTPFRYFTRIHQGDYEEETKKNGYFPFRCFEMRYVSAIYPISEYGAEYIRNRFPSFINHLDVFRLGVNDYGTSQQGTDRFHIMSCSFLNTRKRVHLIVEILQHLKFKVCWTHFGDGELKDEIMKLAREKCSHVHIEFKGHVANSEIIRYYQEHPVDLFINVSEFEGIPVSIMEAISFGVPVIGCNVCGVPEIVNERTGFLLEKSFDPKEAAARIQLYKELSVGEKTSFRNDVKKFWLDYFNAERNYQAFIQEIHNRTAIS